MVKFTAHGSLGAYKRAGENSIKKWEREGEKKVVVKVGSLEELFEVHGLKALYSQLCSGSQCTYA